MDIANSVPRPIVTENKCAWIGLGIGYLMLRDRQDFIGLYKAVDMLYFECHGSYMGVSFWNSLTVYI